MFCQIELHFIVNAAIVWFIVLLDYSLEFLFFFSHLVSIFGLSFSAELGGGEYVANAC